MKFKTFKDLKFEKHAMFGFGFDYQAKLTFDNGYSISVIMGNNADIDMSYPYECAVMIGNNLVFNTPVTDDVIGYCNKNKVTKIMKQIQGLPKVV